MELVMPRQNATAAAAPHGMLSIPGMVSVYKPNSNMQGS